MDIPPGYTHNIENLRYTDMVTVMWANETFDPERPDTFSWRYNDEKTKSNDCSRELDQKSLGFQLLFTN